jgi:hypothetical protein
MMDPILCRKHSTNVFEIVTNESLVSTISAFEWKFRYFCVASCLSSPTGNETASKKCNNFLVLFKYFKGHRCLLVCWQTSLPRKKKKTAI